MVAIRRMREDAAEVEALARLRHATFFNGSERTLDIERRELAAFAHTGPGIGLVAEMDGAIAGCALLVPREIDQRHEVGPWLAGLVVVPASRGQGIGAALVRAIEDEARKQGIARLYLYTGSAEAFYAALGWTVVERFVEDDGSDAILMTTELGPGADA